MNNDRRRNLYLRDRTTVTPAQRRRLAAHDHDADARFNRTTRRKAHRQVLKADAGRLAAIRSWFQLRRGDA